MIKEFTYHKPNSSSSEKFVIYQIDDFEFQNPIKVYETIFMKKNTFSYKNIYPNIKKELEKNKIKLNNQEKEILINRLAKRDWEKWFKTISEVKVQENYYKLLNGKSKKEQVKLLKGMTFKENELTSFIIKSNQKYGFSFSQYRTEHNQKNIDQKELTNFTYLEKDGNVLTSRDSKLSKGQLKQAIEHRTVIIAKFIDKGNEWHCFFTNYKSYFGREKSYKNGQRHFHYISSSWGLTREYVLDQLKNRKYKFSSLPHIDIDN